jgi:diguanylate cyclase (GGDEF)-like protein
VQKSNLLIVDDSPYLHKMVRAYLEPEPVHVESAYDGEAALMLASRLQPSLILLDIDMPQFNGLEVCRRLKSNPATHPMPVMFLTSEASVHHKVKALDLGAVDYLTKPFRPEELRARVRSALQAKHRLDQASIQDAATGLWNRNFLSAVLSPHLSMARRSGQPLSCLVTEVDSLDQLAARHGPELAQRALKTIANVLVEQSRTEDVLCHDGRGRFFLLLPATQRAGAAHLADRIRQEIERQLFRIDRIDAAVTASFGVTDTEVDAVALVDEAEAALQRAQHAGGNLVVVARPPLNGKRLAA